MNKPRRAKFLWTVSPPVIRGLGRAFFSLKVERQAALPDRPFVLAANHYSHLDPPVIAAALDTPIRYLALDHLFGPSKILDWLITGFGAIPTPRGKAPVSAVRTALNALGNGEAVAAFPEATRVSHWGVLPPKPGAAWLSRRANAPLVPTAILGTGRVFGLENNFRPGRIRVVFGEPIEPRDDIDSMMRQWSDWVGTQVARYPELETDGPRRAFDS